MTVNDEQWEAQQERLYDVETAYTKTAGPVEIADVEWVAIYVAAHLEREGGA